MRVRGYVSCVLGVLHTKGTLLLRAWRRFRRDLLDLGCYEISLGDTIGVGTPGQARAMIDRSQSASLSSRSRFTFMTRGGRRWSTFTPVRTWDFGRGMRPWLALEAVLTPRERAATSRPKRCSSSCSPASGFETSVDLPTLLVGASRFIAGAGRPRRPRLPVAMQGFDRVLKRVTSPTRRLGRWRGPL